MLPLNLLPIRSLLQVYVVKWQVVCASSWQKIPSCHYVLLPLVADGIMATKHTFIHIWERDMPGTGQSTSVVTCAGKCISLGAPIVLAWSSSYLTMKLTRQFCALKCVSCVGTWILFTRITTSLLTTITGPIWVARLQLTPIFWRNTVEPGDYCPWVPEYATVDHQNQHWNQY